MQLDFSIADLVKDQISNLIWLIMGGLRHCCRHVLTLVVKTTEMAGNEFDASPPSRTDRSYICYGCVVEFFGQVRRLGYTCVCSSINSFFYDLEFS